MYSEYMYSEYIYIVNICSEYILKMGLFYSNFDLKAYLFCSRNLTQVYF